MKKKIHLIIITTLISSFLFSQKKYPSLLWEISGNGLKENSYLYGTMHVSKKIAYNLSDIFFEKLYSVKQVALESDPDLWLEDIKKDINRYNYNSYTYPRTYYTESHESYVPLFLKPIEINKYKEALILNDYISNATLYRRYGEIQNFQESTYIDMFIYRASKKLNKVFHGLEDMEESQKIVEDSYESYSEYDHYSPKKLWIKKLLKGKSSIEAMEDAYRNQDLDLIDSIHKGIYPEKYLEYMLYLRNDNMVAAMDSLMKTGSLFSAVGAAHLAGNKGIIEKLRAKGYIVRPLTSAYTDKGKSQKEYLEKLIFNHSLSLQENYDGFSIKAPKDFLTISQMQLSYLISLDIPNGSFLSLSKFNHSNFLNKKEYQTTIQSLDSLLYENIPGKILSKKYITQNRYQGIEVISKNNDDQFLNTKILLTPLEVYIFNLNGTKNYESKFKNDIFSSLKLKTTSSSFSEFTPKTGGYTINLPDYRISTDSIPSTITAYDKKSDSYYFVNTQILDDISPENEEYELKRIPFEFMRNLDLKDIETSIIDYTIPYSESIIKLNNQKNLYLKTIINGSHYYLAGIVTNKESLKNEYFNSLRLSTFISSKKLEKFNNKLDGYSINIPYLPKDANEKRTREEIKIVETDSTSENKKSNEYYNYEFRNNYEDYSLENGQKITLSYFSDFHTDSDSLQTQDRIKDFVKTQYDSCSSLKMNFIKTGISSNNYPFYDYTLENKKSAQHYKFRYFYENDKIYEIKYIANKHIKEPNNSAIEEIINNITFFSPEIINDNSNEIIDDDDTSESFESYTYKIEEDSLIWTASNKKNQAIFNQLKAISTDYKKTEDFTLSCNPNSLDSEVLNNIITILDYHNKTKPDFYEKIYPLFKNNGEAELEIINQLISIDQDTKSVKKALNLLKNSKPIPSSEYSIQTLLNYIENIDNAETIILPELLSLLTIEEYSLPILSYLVDLHSNDKLKSKYIGKYKKYFLSEAQKTFKRVLNSSFDLEINLDGYTTYLKDNLNILSIFNDIEYKKLITEIRSTQNPELLILLSELKKPIDLSKEEFLSLSKESIPSQELNNSYKEKFGEDLFNPEKDLTIGMVKRALKQNNYDYYFYSQTDSLTLKEEKIIEFDSKKYKIYFFTINREKKYMKEQNEDTDKAEEIYNGTEIAVIVFDLTKKEDNLTKHPDKSEYCSEYYSDSYTYENSSLLNIIFTSKNLNYYSEEEWNELKSDLIDYLKNKEHKRASTKFNIYEYEYY